MRKISSTISASPSISGLKLGGLILKILSFSETLKPKDSKMDFCRSFGTSTPPNDFILSVLKSKVCCLFSKIVV